MVNAFSVDLEDWFCSHNLAAALPRNEWDKCELRVQQSTERMLDLLDRHRVRATFFVLGWIAERLPRMVEHIHRAGHEIGSHGYSHTLLTSMNARAFEEDLVRSLDILKDITGLAQFGYRAPAFTVVRKTLGFLDIMQRHGVLYDSSVFPLFAHPDYGIPDAPVEIYRHNNGLPEVPMSAVTLGGYRLPCSGGGYFRQMPYAVSRALIRRCHAEGRPLVFYTHPWELDRSFPRVKLPLLNYVRHYRNLGTVKGKLQRLLAEFEFAAVGDILAATMDISQSESIRIQ